MFQLNKSQILSLALNDFDSAIELIDVYLSSSDDILNQLERFFEFKNEEDIKKSAHALKGTVSIWALPELTQKVRQFEESCKIHSLKEASVKFIELKKDLKNLSIQLVIVRDEIERGR